MGILNPFGEGFIPGKLLIRACRGPLMLAVRIKSYYVSGKTYTIYSTFKLLTTVDLVPQSNISTVKPVLKDHPIGHKNVVCQDRWSLVTGSVTGILKCRSCQRK